MYLSRSHCISLIVSLFYLNFFTCTQRSMTHEISLAYLVPQLVCAKTLCRPLVRYRSSPVLSVARGGKSCIPRALGCRAYLPYVAADEMVTFHDFALLGPDSSQAITRTLTINSGGIKGEDEWLGTPGGICGSRCVVISKSTRRSSKMCRQVVQMLCKG